MRSLWLLTAMALFGIQMARAETRTLQFAWSGPNLMALETLKISHPKAIQILQGTGVDELAVYLDLEAADASGDAVRAYQRALRNASTLIGTSPSLNIPEGDCAVVCPGTVWIVLPDSRAVEHLALDLAWGTTLEAQSIETKLLTLRLPATGSAKLASLIGGLNLLGGGADALIAVDTVRGDLLARLSRVARMDLRQIGGKVTLFVDEPEGALVTLDGTPITHFPYPAP